MNLAFGYELKNGEIKLKDLTVGDNLANNYVFTAEVRALP